MTDSETEIYLVYEIDASDYDAHADNLYIGLSKEESERIKDKFLETRGTPDSRYEIYRETWIDGIKCVDEKWNDYLRQWT